MGIFDELNELHSAQVWYETEPEDIGDDDYGLELMLTPAQIRDYAKQHGKAAAASLLLLTGPDGYDGDYEAMMYELCGKCSQNGSQE